MFLINFLSIIKIGDVIKYMGFQNSTKCCDPAVSKVLVCIMIYWTNTNFILACMVSTLGCYMSMCKKKDQYFCHSNSKIQWNFESKNTFYITDMLKSSTSIYYTDKNSPYSNNLQYPNPLSVFWNPSRKKIISQSISHLDPTFICYVLFRWFLCSQSN